jgi:TonB family protein
MKKSILALAAVMSLAQAAALANVQEPVRVGGNVQAPERIKYVPPVYPDIARTARVSGVVILEALVSPAGDVTDARVLKSIPLLDQAAVDAVRQWRYVSTTLNGVPVPVILTVTVNFALDDAPSETVVTNTAPMRSDVTPFTEPIAAEWKGAPPIRVGGDIKPPERVKYVPPVYPAEAQQAKISGVVIIQAIIDENGDVALAKILKSVPLLDDAALAAVNQWKYLPTLVNGVPAPVLMTVTVSFSLTFQ